MVVIPLPLSFFFFFFVGGLKTWFTLNRCLTLVACFQQFLFSSQDSPGDRVCSSGPKVQFCLRTVAFF